MNFSCLFPPNARILSDSVIGDVVQRARDPNQRSFVTLNALEVVRNEQLAHVIPPGKRPSATLLKRKAESTHSSLVSARAMDTCIQSMEQKIIHQRELRRRRQLRYRRKKDRLVEIHKQEIKQLHVEMRLLEQRRQAAHASLPAQGTAWKAAASYFHIFRHGCQLSSGLAEANSKAREDQFDFVQAAMAPDIVYNAARGVEMLMEVWETFSLWFEEIELVLERLDEDTSDSLVATVTASVTISERTLQNVFPHLFDVGIVDKLLGQRIVMQGSTRFEWDCVFSRITRIRDEFDLLTPMLRLLGNVKDVSVLFEKSVARLDFSPSDLVQEKQS